MGINTKRGTDDEEEAEMAKKEFKGRTLDDYYTEGGINGILYTTTS